MSSETRWLKGLEVSIVDFLSRLRSKNNTGYFKYSLNGDLFLEDQNWGLGNAVFAAKILFMLNVLTSHDRDSISAFIASFQQENGYVFDPVVEKKSRFNRVMNALRKLDMNNINNEQTKRAETRQAFAALSCLGSKPRMPFLHIPYAREAIDQYILGLNWKEPWGAGSHVSHLVFFLKMNSEFFGVCKEDNCALIEYVFELIEKFHNKDGSWYDGHGSMPNFKKINAAMKILTAYAVTMKDDFEGADQLVDLCLSTNSEGHACNNLNIVYVLYRCSRKTAHRIDETRDYCMKKLETYKKHYWPEIGGFSFYERRANDVYYGARISKGLPEPDIHGTALFLWGIAMISEICDLGDTIKLKMPIT